MKTTVKTNAEIRREAVIELHKERIKEILKSRPLRRGYCGISNTATTCS